MKQYHYIYQDGNGNFGYSVGDGYLVLSSLVYCMISEEGFITRNKEIPIDMLSFHKKYQIHAHKDMANMRTLFMTEGGFRAFVNH